MTLGWLCQSSSWTLAKHPGASKAGQHLALAPQDPLSLPAHTTLASSFSCSSAPGALNSTSILLCTSTPNLPEAPELFPSLGSASTPPYRSDTSWLLPLTQLTFRDALGLAVPTWPPNTPGSGGRPSFAPICWWVPRGPLSVHIRVYVCASLFAWICSASLKGPPHS